MKFDVSINFTNLTGFFLIVIGVICEFNSIAITTGSALMLARKTKLFNNR